MKLKFTLIALVAMLSSFSFTANAQQAVEVSTLEALQTALSGTGSSVVITETIVIPQGETVVLDLNGKTVNSVFNGTSTTNHIYALNNNGTLTIKDTKGNGSISARGIFVQDGSKLTVESGSIYGIDSNGGSALYQYGGDIVINGGHIEQKAEGTYNFAINALGGTVKVNNGKIAGNHGAIAAGGATVVINGGELVCTGTAGMTDNVLYTYGTGEITINGGKFVADNDVPAGGCCVYDANGKATINGGTFSNSSGGDVWGTTGTTIKGGTFEKLIETQHVAVGATIVNGGKSYIKNENGEMEEAPAYVAKIGEQGYATLTEAFAAAQNNETITLIDNVVLAEVVTIPAGKTLTIDLNGKAISMEESIIATAYAINNLGNLTIKDGVGGGSINARGIYNGYENVATAKITVLSGTINAKGTDGGAAIFNYGVADIQGGNFTSIGGYSLNNRSGASMTIADGVEVTGGIYNTGASLTVTGGNISNSRSGAHTIYAYNTEVAINGGSFHNNNSGNATIMASGSTAAVEITGGTFTLNIVNAASSYLIDATSSATYTISGGSFTGGIRAQGGTKYEITGGTFTNEYGNYNVYEGGDINVSGGTFTGSYAQKFATDNLAAGYELGADGKVTSSIAYVAKIGEIPYETLQAAIEAVQEGETITLTSDVNVTTPAYGQNALNHTRAVSFTLDLNGKKLSADTGNSVFRFNITNSGAASNVTLDIKNGTIVSGSNTWCTVMAAGISTNVKAVMNLENLTIVASKAGDLAVKAWENATINAKNVTVNTTNGAGGFYALGGEIVLDDCTVNQKGLHTAPYLSMAFAVSTNGKMTVNSGTYSAEPTAAAEGNNQGTTHGSWVGGVMNSGGTLIINGGTFSNGNFGDDALATAARGLIFGDTNANIEIKGGTFNALKSIFDFQNNLGGTSPVFTIYGGTYSANPSVVTSYGSVTIADGYSVVENNGVWTVVEAGLSGEGTETNPYIIDNAAELVLFRNSVNAGETKYNAEGVYVALGANIDLAGIDWSVNIGDDCAVTFDGIFDGKDFTISNLTATETAQKGDGYICTGLFGAIYGNAVVKNLTIENVTIDAPFTGNNVAAVVGFGYTAKGSIENVKVIGNININAPLATGVGAIVGYGYSSSLAIKNCQVIGNDGSSIVAKSYAGAVIGYSTSKNINANTVENVTITATGSVGAVAGIMLAGGSAADNTVKNVTLSATGELWANSSAVVAGTITGAVTVSNTTVENVTANGAEASIVGGILVEKPTTAIVKVQAQIGDVYYTTFANAYADAQAGETIVLLADAEVVADETITLDGVNLSTLNGVTLTNNGTVEVKGEVSLNIETLTGEEINFLNGAIVKNSTIGGNVFVAGNVTFRGANTFAMLYDYGTLTDYYGTTAPMKWTVEEGASVTLTNAARYGLGYGDDVTVYGNIENALEARENLTDADRSLFMHGLVAQESKGWNCDSKFTVENAYVAIGSNNSFGNKSGNYGGTYTFNIKNSVVDASRITFYEALSTTTFTFDGCDVKMGTFMTRDADSKFILKNSKVLSTTASNGTDEGNYNKGELTLENSTLTYSAPLKHEAGVINLDGNSVLTAPSISGAGTIEIDATALTEAKTVIVADMSSFTGAINVKGGCYTITSEGVVVERGLTGEGTEANPYLINNVDDLVFFRNSVNAGETKYNAEGVYVALGANIDLAGIDWSVNIGDDCAVTFDGIFDGKDFTISNLTATETAQKGDGYICTGLFGAIYGNAVVKNLTIENVTIDAPFTGNNVAAVVGFGYTAKGSIENVKVIGNININAPLATGVGAIVGYGYSSSLAIKNCQVIGNDGSSIVAKSYAGAVIGYSTSKGINANTVENVSITATGSVGAVAGIMLAGGSAADNTVKNVTLSATGELWANSAAVVAGTITDGSVTVSNTTVENVTANGAEARIVGGILVEKPTTAIVKVQAQIGDVYYTTLDAALAAQGNEVTLLVPVTVAAGETRVLDLQGKTIVGTPAEAKAYAVITNYGDLTITNGTVLCNNTLVASTAYAVNTIVNSGALTVENATIENKNAQGNQIGYAIDNNSTSYDATVVIGEGAVIKVSGSAYYDGIRMFCNSQKAQNNVVVEGGNVSSIWMQNPSDGAEKNTKDVKGSVTINGGEVAALYLEPSANFEAAITAGHVGEVSYFQTSTGRDLTAFITGGTFGHDVTAFCAEHFICQENGDGTYGVIADPSYISEYTIDDANSVDFTNDAEKTVGTLTYKRTLAEGVWNPLYLPFEISVEELVDNYDIAYYNQMISYDSDNNGSFDSYEMEVAYITTGTLRANYPYFIRPKSADDCELEYVAENVTLYPAVEKKIVTSSVANIFTLSGTHKAMNASELDGCYAISADGWAPSTSGIKAHRLYLKIEENDNSPFATTRAKSIRIVVAGEGTTGVEGVKTENAEVEAIYDLSGRRVLEAEKGGIYIVNGVKTLVK